MQSKGKVTVALALVVFCLAATEVNANKISPTGSSAAVVFESDMAGTRHAKQTVLYQWVPFLAAFQLCYYYQNALAANGKGMKAFVEIYGVTSVLAIATLPLATLSWTSRARNGGIINTCRAVNLAATVGFTYLLIKWTFKARGSLSNLLFGIGYAYFFQTFANLVEGSRLEASPSVPMAPRVSRASMDHPPVVGVERRRLAVPRQ